MSRRSLAIVLVALLSACTTLPAPSIVTRTRIVGARVTIEGDPSRAMALPGERASLTYYVLRADQSELVVTAFTACVAGPTVSGITICGGAPIGAVPAGAATLDAPSFVIDVPDAATLGRASGVLSLLASCAGGGSPTLDPETFTVVCDGEMPGRGELSTFTLRVARDAAMANHHPAIADEIYALTGAVAPQDRAEGDPVGWDVAPADLPLENCASLEPTHAFPRIDTIDEVEGERGMADERPPVTLSFDSSEDDRETFVTIDPIDGPVDERETLSFSHYATAGAFERNTSTLDGTDPGPRTATVEWTPPPAVDVPADGLTVRFWWVARDGRGGLDIVERAACIVPAT